MQWHGHMSVPGLAHADGYAIDCVWFLCSTPHAVVITFRGAEPCLQLDRRSDIPTGMTHNAGLTRTTPSLCMIQASGFAKQKASLRQSPNKCTLRG